MIIVSSCLAGCQCRYDGNSKPNEKVINLVADGKALPVCPEQLGGLSTPRLPSELRGNKVFQNDGVDVTAEFEKGAREALRFTKLVKARTAILKARSPSCGCGEIYDGSFTYHLIDGNGIFADLCKKEGIIVRTEEEI
jgi:uncharacterized protein YbbK (DUF523 family)